MGTLLQISGLRKAYNAPVLADFDFELEAGEVHALMGSNGAGKTTLAKILCGLTSKDGGEIELAGQSFEPASKMEATRDGIVMVMQELNVIPTLSIAENLLFHRLPTRFGVISKTLLRRQASAALRRVRLDKLDPDLPAGALGVGQQQLLEIAAALTHHCRVLILDEPTAVLTDPEIEYLFAQVRLLRAQGVGILYVSHRMDEIRRIADRVTVMRDGRRISTRPTADATRKILINEMVGKDVWSRQHGREKRPDAPVVLEVRNLRAPPQLKGVSFKLYKGEILGLAGLVGSGRTECLRALFGADSAESGTISIHQSPASIRHPSDAVALGIGMVPEDRKKDGLLLSQSIRTNATLATLDTYSRHSYIDSTRETEAARIGCGRLDIRHETVEQAVDQLSGGNQQKVIMLRWLLRDSEILLLDEPTRGIDVAAKESIYALLRELADEGKSILVVSSELLELTALCDRIVVMSDGRISKEFTPDNWSQEAITEASFSAFTR